MDSVEYVWVFCATARLSEARETGVLRPFGPLPSGRMQRVNEAQHDGSQDTTHG
jgi:hypothetical protein